MLTGGHKELLDAALRLWELDYQSEKLPARRDSILRMPQAVAVEYRVGGNKWTDLV
jgi:hypothetical protein